METEFTDDVSPAFASEPTNPALAPEDEPTNPPIPRGGFDSVLEIDKAIPGSLAHREETPGVRAQRDLLFGDMPCI